jgi:LacI family transcriptional regulator
VLDAIRSTGYRHNALARTLARGGSTYTIGVALSAQSNPYLTDLVAPIEASATARGSLMLLGETHEDADAEHRLVGALLERRVDGLILAPSPGSAERTLPMLRESGLPAVLIDRAVDAEHFDQVASDNVEPMAALVDHLAGHGHRRIAIVTGLAGLSTTTERLAGYRRGLERNDLPADPAYEVAGGSEATEAGLAMERLWGLPERPTAVVTGNNYMTVGVLKSLRQMGITVPDDLAIGSFDDFEWSDLLDPPLTAVAQNWTTIGHRAIELLTARMTDPDRPYRTERIVASLMLRQSCGCA